VFRLKQPLFLPKGTVVSMRYHYDNSSDNVRNPSNPPKEVKAGIQSTDEMGHFWLQVLPTDEGDQREILQAAVVEDRLKKYPDEFAANFNMGDILLTKGDTAGAIPYFEKAGQANPDSPLSPMELGVAYFTQSKLGEAEQQFRKALQINSAFTDARFNLASVEAEDGDLQSAVTDFRQVLSERSDYPKARDHLGDVLFAWGDELAKSGDNQQAAQRYKDALEFRPTDVALHTSLGAAFARMGQMQNARAELTTAVHLDPNFQPAQKLLLAIGQ
jgi:Flp pilus assembly protein TadD